MYILELSHTALMFLSSLSVIMYVIDKIAFRSTCLNIRSHLLILEDNDEWDFLDQVDLDNILDVFAPNIAPATSVAVDNSDTGVQVDTIDADTLDMLSAQEQEEANLDTDRSTPILVFVRQEEFDQQQTTTNDDDGAEQ